MSREEYCMKQGSTRAGRHLVPCVVSVKRSLVTCCENGYPEGELCDVTSVDWQTGISCVSQLRWESARVNYGESSWRWFQWMVLKTEERTAMVAVSLVGYVVNINWTSEADELDNRTRETFSLDSLEWWTFDDYRRHGCSGRHWEVCLSTSGSGFQ